MIMKRNKHQEIKDLKSIPKLHRPHPSYYEHIKILFVEGELNANNTRVWPKIIELAKRFKLKPGTLEQYAIRENWKLIKSQFLLKLEATRQDKRIEILSSEAVKFDRICFNAANQIIEKITVDLQKTSDLFKIESIVRSLEKAQKVGRLATGESTSNSRKDLVVTFSQGLNMIRKNLESHPELLKKLKDDTVDGDANILPDIDLNENNNVYERLNIKED